RRADFGRKKLRLLPRGEVAALVHLVEVDEVTVGSLYPAPRRAPELAGEDREYRGKGDLPLIDDARVLPVEPRRGGPGVGDPVERDVVQDRVSGEAALGAPFKGV